MTQLDTSETDPPLRALRRALAAPLVANVAKGETALAPEVLHEDVSFSAQAAGASLLLESRKQSRV